MSRGREIPPSGHVEGFARHYDDFVIFCHDGLAIFVEEAARARGVYDCQQAAVLVFFGSAARMVTEQRQNRRRLGERAIVESCEACIVV
jgi:hypothetical protein